MANRLRSSISPRRHTDGDSIVHFRRSDVVAAGDIFLTTSYPFIDVARGGSLQGEVDALNTLVETAVPLRQEEGGTYVIPGHGRIVDRFEVVGVPRYGHHRPRSHSGRHQGRDDAGPDSVRAGLTLDYDYRYGAKTGRGTPGNFVESVYKSLTKTK